MHPLITSITQPFEINKKNFFLQTDFTFEELDFLNVVLDRLNVNKDSNEISGIFTKEEIKKTLKILLKDAEGKEFIDLDLQNMHDDQPVKIISAFIFVENSIRSHYKKLFDELNETQKKAEQEFIDLRGYRVKYYEPKIKLSENESILFFLFENNLIEAKNAKASIPRKMILDAYYLARVNRLNELLTGIQQMKRINKDV